MVNGCLPAASRPESFAGRGRDQGGFCRAAGAADFALSYLILRHFLPLARRLQSSGEPRLGRAAAARSGEACLGRAASRSSKGSMTDGECASDRTVATDRAAARARRRRQQHRQHEHHRLQGRRLDVRGIPDAGARAGRSAAPTARQLRAGPRDLARHERQGAVEQTGNPLDVAIDGDGFLVVQTPRGERYTRNGSLQINADRRARHQRRATGARRRRPDHVPADRPTTSRSAPTARSACARAIRTADSRAASCGSSPSPTPQQLQKDGDGTFNRADGVTPQPAPRRARGRKARSRNPTCAASSRCRA